MTKTPQQKGKDFEQKVQDALMELRSKYPTNTLRLYDTRSAGNLIPSQPGDFFTVFSGKAILIEVKSSSKHSSLVGSRAPLNELFDKEQIAKMRLWHRAKADVRVVFQCQRSNRMEIWDGNYVAECYVTPRKHLDPDYAGHYNKDEFDELIKDLVGYRR